MAMRSRLYDVGVLAVVVCVCGGLRGPSATFRDAPPDSAELKNPYGGDPNHVKAGAKLFRQSCASCHGADATGKGKSPNLRTETVSKAAPGALFWFIRAGAPKKGMPGFSRLPDQRIWQIVTFLQAEPVPAH